MNKDYGRFTLQGPDSDDDYLILNESSDVDFYVPRDVAVKMAQDILEHAVRIEMASILDLFAERVKNGPSI